jgi:chemotaxis protein CheD
MSVAAASPLPDAAPPRGLFLMPGSVHCAPEPLWVTTILGSCVAVCLWDAVRRCGGMNHYLLPRCNVKEPSARYGDVAIDMLLDGMVGLRCRIQDLRAKIFGGAALLPFGATADKVGNGNVRLAQELLHQRQILIVASRTGGTSGVQVRFNTESGDVLIRSIASGSAVRPCPADRASLHSPALRHPGAQEAP